MYSKPALEIIISGHTDDTGTEKHNLQLSEHRARAVAEYLLDKGIDPNRIQHTGYGSAKPVMNNDTATGRLKNRRVEMLIRSKRWRTWVSAQMDKKSHGILSSYVFTYFSNG